MGVVLMPVVLSMHRIGALLQRPDFFAESLEFSPHVYATLVSRSLQALIQDASVIASQPAWMLVNMLIRIRREPKNSLFP
jgi:hypothetical protein